MASGYYIRKPSAEWEAVERWENEGGRLRQRHDYGLDSIGEDYTRHMERAIPIKSLGKRNEINPAMLLHAASDKANYIAGQPLVMAGEQTLSRSVFAV